MTIRTRLAVPLIALCLLGACQAATTVSDNNALQATEYACASATAALKTAIAFDAKLSATMRANVNRAVAVIDPVCSQENPPTLDSTARAALNGALTQLTSVATEVSK